jgi:hypothetical protein
MQFSAALPSRSRKMVCTSKNGYGEEISKGKLGSAIVTMDACNSEKLSDLNVEGKVR